MSIWKTVKEAVLGRGTKSYDMLDSGVVSTNAPSTFDGLRTNNAGTYYLSNYFGDRKAYFFYDLSRPLATSVDKIAEAFGGIKPMIWDSSLEDFVDDNPVLDLLRSPGFGQTYKQFATDCAISFLLTRNMYVIVGGNVNAKPLTLLPAKPFWANIVEGADGFASTYILTRENGSGGSMRFERASFTDFRFLNGNFNELIHAKGQTTDDMLRGRSPIVALLYDLTQNIYGAKHNAALLQNEARPSGVMEQGGDVPLTDDQFTRLKDEIREMYSGADNAGRPMLLEGGITWKDAQISNRDMDYVNLMNMNEVGIAKRFKIPIALISPDSLTYNNYATAVVDFYDDAVRPLMDTIYGAWSRTLFPRFGIDGNRFKLKPDPLAIEAEQIRLAERAKIKAEVGSFVDNEIRADFGAAPIPGGNTLYKKDNMVPAIDIESGEAREDRAESEGDGTQEEQRALKVFIEHCGRVGVSEKSARSIWSRK